jgi:transposase
MASKIDHAGRKESIRLLIARGRSNRDIAIALGLDLRTVDHYIRRYGLTGLRRELGIRSAPARPAPAHETAPQRQCLGCGTKIRATPGRWLCDQCRSRRAYGSRGVPDHWLETPGHG